MRRLLFPLSLIALLAAPLAGASAAVDELANIECDGGEVCRIVETRLPLKLLPRPFAVLYKDQSGSDILNDNIRAFYPLYVFAREGVDYSDPDNPKGWYQVGPTEGRPVGWMKAGDVVEWTQALIVSYAHPGADDDRRKPVVGFTSIDPIQNVVENADRSSEATQLYDAVENGAAPEGFVMREPGPGWLDIEEDFYLMPIIAFQENEFAERDQPERLLQLIAAVPGKRAGGDEGAAAAAAAEGAAGEEDSSSFSERLQALNIDVVFVIDTTGSMQPFLDLTKTRITDLARRLSSEGLFERLRFGIIGYRDDTSVVPELEYVARNFTPDLVGSDQLAQILDSQVRAATVGSNDYQEEVYAGIDLLGDVNWSDNSLRFVVLVGDASSHESLHPQSTTGKKAEELRAQLSASDVNLIALHLLAEDPQYMQELRADQEIAKRQFTTLARNEGLEGNQGDYIPIPNANVNDYDAAMRSIYDVLTALAGASAQGSTAGAKAAVKKAAQQAAASGSGAAQQAAATTANIVSRFLIDYQGDEAEARPDVVFWVSDRDLIDPSRQSMEVRLLISRADLNDLAIALESVYTALLEGQLTGEGFMKTLQAVITDTMAKSDVNLEDAERLAETSLLPKWLEALPYRSDVQSLSDAAIQGMTDEERYQLEERLKSKIAYYKSTFADTDNWIVLTDEDKNVTERHVYPIPLDNLP